MSSKKGKNTELKIKKSNIINNTKSKIKLYNEIINKTILSSQKYKTLDIFSANELNVCIKNLHEIYDSLQVLHDVLDEGNSYNDIITRLQTINDNLSSVFRSFGTETLGDLLNVCFGSMYLSSQINENNKEKAQVLLQYLHPINYKILNWKENKEDNTDSKKENCILSKNKIVEDFMILEISKTFDCFDLARTSQNFQTKVYGIKVSFQNTTLRQTLIVSAIVDDVFIDCFQNYYIVDRLKSLLSNVPKDPIFSRDEFIRFSRSLTLKEFLVYSNDELYNRFVGYINQVKLIKQKPISQVVKEFLNSQLYLQRTTLIQLLLKHNDSEYQYLAYLLYDLLSNDNNGVIDTLEQTILYDSLPWNIKKYFKEAMKTTINYTNSLTNFDNNKIPLEQQICLMKVDESVKEKAMTKLKEVKAKSDDTGSKARQFLEGLLKIPFGIYKQEELLYLYKELHTKFQECVTMLSKIDGVSICVKNKYTLNEINKIIEEIRKKYFKIIEKHTSDKIIVYFTKGKRDSLVSSVHMINDYIKTHKISCPRLIHSGKKNEFMKEQIKEFFTKHKKNNVINTHFIGLMKNEMFENLSLKLEKIFLSVDKKQVEIKEKIGNITDILDDSVHGHKNAKRQIERIIGQWITGKQTGYCFGFEGAPGLGKTSLAKRGIAKCLKDKDGNSRPFTFIAIGGSSNGSVLDGHNYTYVGSTWGKIVDALMDTKCMNPIIFIDELDKVSKTEHGKEIIGILTHLVDTTQNDTFQDKYFSGIDLDLSKVLFIFSYNDVSAVDRILLDRIHRIKFNGLTLHEKIEISNKFILPEIYEKMGLENSIVINDDMLRFIISNYTNESGVRKLKEVLFEIISEINLTFLESEDELEMPFVLTENMVKYNFLKERNENRYICIPNETKVGIINGLWANYYGMGGIIPIEVSFFPTTSFLELKLTGMQGDVMKESMQLAKTIAWKLTDDEKKEKLLEDFEKNKLQGIHIHCPEGATPKDGPSAGGAITMALYSLLNNKVVPNTIAMTGEINMQGNITAIGGLELKILGGMRGGVTTFIYPEENHKDFVKFKERFENVEKLDNITFHEVKHIEDVIKIIF